MSKSSEKKQKIVVFQQKRSGESKIAGIRDFGRDRFIIETVDIDVPLPDLIENGLDYLPETIDADLVLDFLRHPDLSSDLWQLCKKLKVPVVASNRKSTESWVDTPLTCCDLRPRDMLGEYGQRFGIPEFRVTIKDGIITDVTVLHGAPCGSTWEAAKLTIGVPVDDAPVHIGLETQYYCTANPAGWDVIHGKSPVHYAAELHKTALERAIGLALNKGELQGEDEG